jgi:amino acid transporter
MFWKQLFAKKSLEMLKAEAEGDNRLRRVLGPIALTSLGVGAIIGSGIFVMTGRVAANDAGPAIMLSFVVAGIGCLFAALCYAEFASMAPVAGSAYTYAYATLGELLAWIIGWDLILEYAMACACVAAGWSQYLNEFIGVVFGDQYKVPAFLCSDPFSDSGAWLNLPALLITLLVTVVLVIGIRESATTNAALVMVKVGVVLFVIFAGAGFVSTANWTGVPASERVFPEDLAIPDLAEKEVKEGTLSQEEARQRIEALNKGVAKLYGEKLSGGEELKKQSEKARRLLNAFYQETAKLPKEEAEERTKVLSAYLLAMARLERRKKELDKAVAAQEKSRTEADAELAQLKDQLKTSPRLVKKKELGAAVAAKKMTPEDAKKAYANLDRDLKDQGIKDMYLPPTPQEEQSALRVFGKVEEEAKAKVTKNWGILGLLGLNDVLANIDDRVRSPFIPYGLGGIIFGASIVFFAYIGFDSISTHAEEARKPQRDVPIGILASLIICTVLYILVAAVLTGMVQYSHINPKAAVASAFTAKGKEQDSSLLLGASALISTGALAGLTSVLLITFLSQARIFLAMARDRLLPPAIFGAIHPRFRTPHLSTMLTGGIISLVAAFTPITKLEEMVNIGTLMAFVIVCASVLLLRIQSPSAERPFRAPLLFGVAPLGILVNLLMMLFLPVDTWLRLVVWLVLGLLIYFFYGSRQSALGKEMRGELPAFGNGVPSHEKAIALEPPIPPGLDGGIQRPGTDIHGNV